MSLKVSNLATARQKEILTELEYMGRGKYALEKLTVEDAAKLIDELFTEKKYTVSQISKIAADYYNMPITEVASYDPEDIDDPFSEFNKRRSK